MAIFKRIIESDRPTVSMFIDDKPVLAYAGDTVLTAILTQRDHIRHSDVGGLNVVGTSQGVDVRAGFCLMGACHDCWVRSAEGPGLRACSVLVRENMHILIDR